MKARTRKKRTARVWSKIHKRVRLAKGRHDRWSIAAQYAHQPAWLEAWIKLTAPIRSTEGAKE